MLSYYVTWHMQARLAPILFTDDDKPGARAARPTPLAPAARYPKALAQAAAKHTPAAVPVHSFSSLLTDLVTICLNTIAPADPTLSRLPARHHPDRRPAPGLRPARRQPPLWRRVVSSAPRTSRKPR